MDSMNETMNYIVDDYIVIFLLCIAIVLLSCMIFMCCIFCETLGRLQHSLSV